MGWEMLRSRMLPSLRLQRSVFQQRPIYQPKEGIRYKEEVVNESRNPAEESPEDYTFTGKKKVKDYFYYSDRKSGKGYSDFSHSPFPKRPYTYPPVRGMQQHMKWIMLALVSVFFIDYYWISYQIVQALKPYWPDLPKLFDEMLNPPRYE